MNSGRLVIAILSIGCSPLVTQAVGAVESAAAVKPDVLFIAIDDMNDWTTLFDKKNPIKTPNLERLAGRGMFFTKGYCAVAACCPSRAAIMTGIAPYSSGVYGNGDAWARLMPDAVTVSRYFGLNGYETYGAGKIFHHGVTGKDIPDKPSFQNLRPFKADPPPPGRKNRNGYTREDGCLFNVGYDWGERAYEEMIDKGMVEWCERVMATPPVKPRFLAAGIFKPHLPFYAPPDVFKRYLMDDTVLPPMPEHDLDDVPEIGRRMAHTEPFIYNNVISNRAPSPRSLKRMVQCYQASADFSDSMVGRLLSALDKSGRADRTVIVLFADHGYHLGDKESCVKFTLWEKANHVPFIIVAPGVAKPGSRCDKPVSLLDIYPTLVDLAGLPARKEVDGLSLVPLLKDPNAEWTRPALMTMGEGNHAVRNDRWRYIRYSDGMEELYDHEKDPWEFTNLAGKPEHAPVIAEMKKWLPAKEVSWGGGKGSEKGKKNQRKVVREVQVNDGAE